MPTIRPTDILSRSSSHTVQTPANSTQSNHYVQDDRERTPTQPAQSALMQVANGQTGSPNGDWSGTLQSLLNSPVQLQRLMHALAAQQNQPVASMPSIPPLPSSDVEHQTLDPRVTTHQVAPYDPNAYDFSHFRSELPSSANNHAQSAALAPLLLGPLSQKEEEGPSLEPLVENASRLQKTYHDASEIDADVDALQYSLNSLINGLGLDTSTLASASHTPDESMASHAPDGSIPPGPDPTADFDFDAFFNELSNRNSVEPTFPDVTSHFDPTTPLDGTTVGDASTDQLTAFLDDVSSSASDSLNDSLDFQPKTTVGAKRKSDVAELPPPLLSGDAGSDPSPKVKRKR